MMEPLIKKMLDDFFGYTYERNFEKEMLNGSFVSIRDETLKYIDEIVSVPISMFMEYISNFCKRQPIVAADVFQFSDFDDATTHICSQINTANNPGVKFKEVGKLLLDDGIKRNDVALSKYGENHIKTAEALGLAFKDSAKNYYLTSTGSAFSQLSEKNREKLLTRLIVRNKLITQLFVAALNGPFDLEPFLYDLSKSTYLRRRTNINRVLEILNHSSEYDFLSITQNIMY